MFPGSLRGEFIAGPRSGWWIVTFASLLAFVVIVTPAPGDSGKAAIEDAGIGQSGRALVMNIQTKRQVALKELERLPDLKRPKARYLCIEMTRAGTRLINRICLGGKKRSSHAVGITRANRANEVFSKKAIKATVTRVAKRRLRVSIQPGRARLRPAGYSWRAVYSDGSCGSEETSCRSSFPLKHDAKYRLKPVKIVGCSGGNGQVVRNGPRGRKRVALTFDDGPSTYTPRILRILKAHNAKATFFVLGSLVERYPDTARRILNLGHELANHSSNHALLPSGSDIHRASAVIRDVTGFRPCLFRPPYGALSSSVIESARRSKMKSVIWDVDTVDWKLPGSGSISASIKRARSGSIVLMHGGGGPRSQTVDALAGAIESLQRRGYKLVTVTELLNNHFIYRPR